MFGIRAIKTRKTTVKRQFDLMQSIGVTHFLLEYLNKLHQNKPNLNYKTNAKIFLLKWQ